MKINLALVILLVSGSFFAQTEAVTKDGKNVMLYKNGTWKYVKSGTPKGSAKVAAPINENLKNEARQFSEQLVSSYFKGDCSFLLQSMAGVVITFKGPLTITNEHMSKVCEGVKNTIVDTTKTFNDYLTVYKMELLTREEIEAKVKSKLPDHFNSADDEFYFLGFEQKTPGATTSFVRNDLFTLLLRKVDGKWQVKGFLSD